MDHSSPEDPSMRARKRVRKGTRSCIACRRRKTKCIFQSEDSNVCLCCAKGGFTCAPQGFHDEESSSGIAHSRLKQRVATLNALVEQLIPDNNHEACGSLEDQDDPLVQALDRLLPDIQAAVKERNTTQTQDGPTNKDQTKDQRDEISEQQIESPLLTASAPLMRLLNNPVFGKAPNLNGDSIMAPSGWRTQSGELQSSRKLQAQQRAAEDLCSVLPPAPELSDLVENKGAWWTLWRNSIGLTWGGAECTTLRSFAAMAMDQRDPSLIGTLLVALAICTGDLHRYLSPVERQILNDDKHAGTEHGLGCLMILGLCYINALQPRKAWTVYRKANTLLQLNGIHMTPQRTARQDRVFWHLFHADRWISLIIGLPYMLPDNLCNVEIHTDPALYPGTYLYRRLTVITGRVIDHLQDSRELTLSSALEIEDQMDEALSHLNAEYLDLSEIRKSHHSPERMERLYRVVHFFQLRSCIYLPLFLRPSETERYEFSRSRCIGDSRKLLESYVMIYQANPRAASDGSVLNYNAFLAAIVLVLGALNFGRSCHTSSSQVDQDWQLIHETCEAIKYGTSVGISGALCRKCYEALHSLVTSARAANDKTSKTVILPYFGAISIKRNDSSTPLDAASQEQTSTVASSSSGVIPSESLDGTNLSAGFQEPLPTFEWQDYNLGLSDISLAYHGPLASTTNLDAFAPHELGGTPSMHSFDDAWSETLDQNIDWSWLCAGLPP